MRIYAIADIHGQLEMLEVAHRRISDDRARTSDEKAPVVHLGDLVDRGPDSKGVIDFLIEGEEAGAPWIVLKGNHDRMFQGFVATDGHHDPRLRRDLTWLDPRLGGEETLASYGVKRHWYSRRDALHRAAREKVPQTHVDFLGRLRLYHATPELLFVHAGIRPGVAPEKQNIADLLWIRDQFLDSNANHGHIVVHGHSVAFRPEIRHNRIGIDTGAYATGILSCVVLEGEDQRVINT